jgi:succinate dehydrogenase / fumarate reductase cytochrome b subunit
MRYHPYHAPLQPTDRSNLRRRAFSLSGLFPLGAFLFLHLGVNLRALAGDRVFAATVDALHRSRAYAAAELLLVFLPLLVHALIGLQFVMTGEALSEPSPYSAPVLATLRGTGLAVAVFLGLHLFELHVGLGGPRPDGGMLATLLAAGLGSTRFGVPWRGVGYLVASGCAVYHLVVGAWGSYARTAHATARPGRSRWAAVGAAAIGLLLGLGYLDVVVFHATGRRLISGAAAAAPASCP